MGRQPSRPVICWLSTCLCLHTAYRAKLYPGNGKYGFPHDLGVSEFLMRIVSDLLLPVLVGETGALYAEVIAWIGVDLIPMLLS